jgi:hypothetical protein
MAALVATGVAMSGERRVLGIELSAGNDEGSAWPIVHPLARGSRPPRRAPGDQRRSRGTWSRPSASSSLGSGWQRCRVHLTRNAQDLVPRSARSMIASGSIGLRAARRAIRPRAVRSGHRLARTALPGRRRSCCSMPRATSWPTSRSPRPTAARSAAPTPSSGSTRRSSAGPRSWASSPTELRSSAWSA